MIFTKSLESAGLGLVVIFMHSLSPLATPLRICRNFFLKLLELAHSQSWLTLIGVAAPSKVGQMLFLIISPGFPQN